MSSARQCAKETIQKAQKKYKTQYDKKTKAESTHYNVGEWILIKHPQEESGPNRKLSRPWYGPFRITGVEKTGVTAERIYCNSQSKDQIRVHLHQVTRCPPAFPAGCYWYGGRRNGPGRPPEWIDNLVNKKSGEEQASEEEQVDLVAEEQDDQTESNGNSEDEVQMDRRLAEPADENLRQTEVEPKDKIAESNMKLMVPRKTRTRDVRPPNRYS